MDTRWNAFLRSESPSLIFHDPTLGSSLLYMVFTYKYPFRRTNYCSRGGMRCILRRLSDKHKIGYLTVFPSRRLCLSLSTPRPYHCVFRENTVQCHFQEVYTSLNYWKHCHLLCQRLGIRLERGRSIISPSNANCEEYYLPRCVIVRGSSQFSRIM